MKIFVITEKENISNIKEILKSLAPETEVGFIASEDIKKLDKTVDDETQLVFNYDNQEVRSSLRHFEIKKFSFGFLEKADFFASDQINTEAGISFKLNYNGNSVPIWVKSPFDKERIYNFLAALCVGIISGKSVIEMSEKLKNL